MAGDNTQDFGLVQRLWLGLSCSGHSTPCLRPQVCRWPQGPGQGHSTGLLDGVGVGNETGRHQCWRSVLMKKFKDEKKNRWGFGKPSASNFAIKSTAICKLGSSLVMRLWLCFYVFIFINPPIMGKNKAIWNNYLAKYSKGVGQLLFLETSASATQAQTEPDCGGHICYHCSPFDFCQKH